MNGPAAERLRAAVAGRPVVLPAGTETAVVAVDDLVELLVDAGQAMEARRKLADVARLAESFIARVAQVPEADLPLYRSVLDSMQAAMAAAGVELVADDPVAA